MYKPTTLKDIAIALNVSISTVSRALANSYQISEECKEKISETARAMNYKSNSVALKLRNTRSYAIGVIISEVDNIFFSRIIEGIECVAYEKGYHVVITQSHDKLEREIRNLKHLVEGRIDGILMSLIAESHDAKYLKKIHELGTPIVFFDRTLEGVKTHKVVSDNFQGASDATTFLFKKGCRRIAFLGDTPTSLVTQQRLLGYNTAIKQNGAISCNKLVKYTNPSNNANEGVENAVLDLMNLEVPPEAILTATEQISQLCLQHLKKHGFHGRVSVAGFSNCDIAKLFNPPFTCVRQNTFEMGKIAAKKLIDLIENGEPVDGFETLSLPTVLDWNE